MDDKNADVYQFTNYRKRICFNYIIITFVLICILITINFVTDFIIQKTIIEQFSVLISYSGLIKIIVKVLIYASVSIVTSIIFLYKSNVDTILLSLGTLQKKIMIAGLEENLLLERKEFLLEAGIVADAERMKIERKQLRNEIKDQRLKLRLVKTQKELKK